MRARSMRRARVAGGSLAAAVAVAGLSATAAIAVAPKMLPASAGRIHTCHTTLYKVSGRLPVHTEFATRKGAPPAMTAFTCTDANAVARAGKRFYDKPPFHTGKKVKVAGVTYTLGFTTSVGGKPASGPIYGWSGGGMIVYLINPTGA
jgi:hypothetical protein